jgi:hypothetical protein
MLVRGSWLVRALPALFLLLTVAACNGEDKPAAETRTPTPTPEPPTTARIAFLNSDGNVGLMNSNGSDAQIITGGGGVLGLKPSLSGELLALDVGSGVRVIRLDGSQVFEIDGATAPVWGPVQDRLAVIAADSVRLVEADGAGVLDIPRATRPAWSSDGTRIAVFRLDGTTGVPILVDVDSGSETLLSNAIEPHSPDYPIAWHPSGQAVAYRERVYEPATGIVRELPGVAVNWSPDGRMLLVTLPDDPVRGTVIGRLLDATQGLKEVIGIEIPDPAQTPGWIFVQKWVTWTPIGRHFLYMDPTVTRERLRVFDTIDVRQVPYRNIRGEQPRVSPDNSTVVFVDMGRIWVLTLDGSKIYSPAEGFAGDWVR